VHANNIGMVFVVAKSARDIIVTDVDLLMWVGNAHVVDPSEKRLEGSGENHGYGWKLASNIGRGVF
jgi:hypothetical protein